MKEKIPRSVLADLTKMGMSFWEHFRAFEQKNRSGSMIDFDLLRYLQKVKQSNLNEMAQKINVTPPAASKIIERMQKQGLVERHSSSTDRREIVVSMTKKGRKVFKKMSDAMNKEMEMLFEGISRKEIDAYLSTQKKIIENMARISEK